MELLEERKLKKETYVFVIITFAATFILQLGIYAIAGPLSYSSPFWNVALSGSMFMPAVVAIFCMFYFKSKALTRNHNCFYILFELYSNILFESFSTNYGKQ